MKKKNVSRCFNRAALLPLLCLLHPVCAGEEAKPQQKPLVPSSVKASSSRKDYPPQKAIDGNLLDDRSRWISEPQKAGSWIELGFDGPRKLSGLHIYSGYGATAAIRDFTVQFWSGGTWRDIPSATVLGNEATALAVIFDSTVEVNTDRLRLNITASDGDVARVNEILVWPFDNGGVPPLAYKKKPGHADDFSEEQEKIPLLYVNQSGFNLGRPKRFTAPTLADGTAFIVRKAAGGKGLFEGVIKGNIGDFTAFDPEDHGQADYVVEAGGLCSVAFRIGRNWLERVSYQGMVDFMVDSRHYVGTYKKPCGGSFSWRDDHHFGWELTTLVPQYFSNPSAYDRMPRQITYEKPTAPGLWGKLEPYSEEAPDMVKMIHWGADVIVTQGCTHEMLKAQLAYFLYAWPWMEKYLPEQNYQLVRDYAFKVWAEPKADRKYPYDESPEHNLLALKTRVGHTKGTYPPGFSVIPNLLMHEVARREKRADADLYLEAAARQVEWLVNTLDWEDPQTTKGQRMSEFITLTSLGYAAAHYPKLRTPALIDKINAWAAVVVRRSDNLWDFRKYEDKELWTPKADKSDGWMVWWNEPGNVVGLPSALLAAKPFLKDPGVAARFDQLVFSLFDNCFGRNPTGRHFSYDAPREIEGVEFGWYRFCPGGVGQLATARFVLDGSPKSPAYPYDPGKGAVGYTEGWIQFNVAYNISMAYLDHSLTRVKVERAGDELVVTLEAPLNFDYANVETGVVQVTGGAGDAETLTVTETAADSNTFVGRMNVVAEPRSRSGDNILQTPKDAAVKVSYGYGYMEKSASLHF